MTKTIGPIDIYLHSARSGEYGLRYDLPGGDRIDVDGSNYVGMAENCAWRLLQRERREKSARDGKKAIIVQFVIVDRCRTFEPGKSEAKVLDFLEVRLSGQTVKRPGSPALALSQDAELKP